MTPNRPTLADAVRAIWQRATDAWAASRELCEWCGKWSGTAEYCSNDCAEAGEEHDRLALWT